RRPAILPAATVPASCSLHTPLATGELLRCLCSPVVAEHRQFHTCIIITMMLLSAHDSAMVGGGLESYFRRIPCSTICKRSWSLRRLGPLPAQLIVCFEHHRP